MTLVSCAELIEELVTAAAVAGADETGLRVGGTCG